MMNSVVWTMSLARNLAGGDSHHVEIIYSRSDVFKRKNENQQYSRSKPTCHPSWGRRAAAKRHAPFAVLDRRDRALPLAGRRACLLFRPRPSRQRATRGKGQGQYTTRTRGQRQRAEGGELAN